MESESGEEPVPWAWVKRIRDLTGVPSSRAPALPVEILPWLYLSDETNVRNTGLLSVLNVTHVLSLNEMSPWRAQEISGNLEARGIVHKRISAQDEEGYDMIGQHWDECRAFLQMVRNIPGGKAVVHCVAGINRSGLIVCAAHMVLERAPVLTVVERCVQARKIVLWNRSFQEQLCLLAAKEGLLGDKPEGYSDEPIESFVAPPPASRALDRLF